MSLSLTVTTTANRTRRFFQTDPVRVEEILAGLRRAAQLFTARTLVIVGEDNTEVFSPRAITRIEIETALDLKPYLPPAWELKLRALSPLEITADGTIDAATIQSRVDCFFDGGDTLAAWLDSARPDSPIDRGLRLNALFEQAVIPYLPSTAGIGLINPATLTRIQLGAALSDPPAGAWHLSAA